MASLAILHGFGWVADSSPLENPQAHAYGRLADPKIAASGRY
jgi:hypothetical protein